MPKFYLNNNAQDNGDHEVHKEDCFYLQFVVSITDLGMHDHCFTAVARAQTIQKTADGCKTCLEDCHSR